MSDNHTIYPSTLSASQLILYTELVGKTTWQVEALNGNIVESIRALRYATGAPLKPAKEAVEMWRNQHMNSQDKETELTALRARVRALEEAARDAEPKPSPEKHPRQKLGVVDGFDVYRIGEVFEVSVGLDSLEQVYRFLERMCK